MNSGQLVQVTGGVWKGCIGSVVQNVKADRWLTQLHRDTTVVVSQRDLYAVADGDIENELLPAIYKDAQIAAVDFQLGGKLAALTTLVAQIDLLNDIKERCENGGTFERADRVRLGAFADGASVGF